MRFLNTLFIVGGIALVGCGGGTDDDGSPEPSSCPQTTTGPTDHSGTITANETWTAATGPHTVSANFYVEGGATLTIEPCVAVEIAADVRIVVGSSGGEEGTLIAEATADKPISFFAKDTDPWDRLHIEYPGTAFLANVTFEGGGANITSYDGATIVADADSEQPIKPILKVTDVRVKGSQGYGILMRYMASFISGSTGLTISGSGAAQTPDNYPIFVDAASLGTLPAGAYTGNTANEIRVDPFYDVESDVTIYDVGVPYYVSGRGSRPEVITVVREFSNTTGAIPVLTVDAGVVLKFGTDSSETGALRIGTSARPAGLVVQGTAANPVTFTSAAESPAAGDWRGLVINDPVDSTVPISIDYAEIKYAGYRAFCTGGCVTDLDAGTGDDEAAALSFCGWQPDTAGVMRNSTISDSAGWGVLRAWRGFSTGPDFTASAAGNTFSNVAFCSQSMRKPASGESCPTSPRLSVPSDCGDALFGE